jgi:transcriptional regulator with XRE-family HTH domain
MSTFQKLVEYRIKLKVSQKEMALYLNCTKSTLSRYENGNRKISSEMQDLYCKKLGVGINLIIL